MKTENKGQTQQYGNSGIHGPFTDGLAGTAPSTTSAPGIYSQHPNVGPAGEAGGFPLKFVDTSVAAVQPSGASNGFRPAGVTKP